MRAVVSGPARARVETGVPALDHLLGLLAEYAAFDLALEVEPGAPVEEVTAAGRALGEALAPSLRRPGGRGYGSAVLPRAEALAHVALEVSEQPLVVSNVDLSEARMGGLAGDVVRAFLDRLAEGAGLTLHVRLIEGSDPQHVLEAIFKALGAALGQACREPIGKGGGTMQEKVVVCTNDAPPPFQGAPYSQAIKAGGFVFVAGQVAARPDGSGLVGDTIEEQTEQVMDNVKAILEAAGTSLDRLVKTTVFLADLEDFQGMNAVYRRYVGDAPPARSTIQTGGLPPGVLVEIEAIAVA